MPGSLNCGDTEATRIFSVHSVTSVVTCFVVISVPVSLTKIFKKNVAPVEISRNLIFANQLLRNVREIAVHPGAAFTSRETRW
jgi:hypothetical protein